MPLLASPLQQLQHAGHLLAPPHRGAAPAAWRRASAASLPMRAPRSAVAAGLRAARCDAGCGRLAATAAASGGAAAAALARGHASSARRAAAAAAAAAPAQAGGAFTEEREPLVAWLEEATRRVDLVREAWEGLPVDDQGIASSLMAQDGELRASLQQCPLGDPADSTTIPRHLCSDPLVRAHGEATRAILQAELARSEWEIRLAEASGGADPSSIAAVRINMAMLRMRLFDLDAAIEDLHRAFDLDATDSRLGLLLRYSAQLRAPREPDLLEGADLSAGGASDALLKKVRLAFLNAGYVQGTVLRAAKATSMSEFIFVEGNADRLEQSLLESCEEPNPMNPEPQDGLPRIPGELVDLIRIFLLHRVLPLARLSQLLGPECLQLLLTLRAVTAVEGDACRMISPAEAAAAVAADPTGCNAFFAFANVAVWPIEEDLLLCADFEQTYSAEDMEPVMYISEDSWALVHGAPRAKASSVLDVCCGSGIQGIVALRTYADRAAFVDLNPRALRFTRFNLALNGFAARCLGLYSGHLEEALPAEVLERGFDALVANPPFVPNPHGIASGAGAMFGNGGDSGEDVLAAVVRLGSRVVRPGGTVSAVAMTPNAEGLPGRITRWYASAAGEGASFEANVFCGAPTPADRYQPTSTQAETARYQASLRNMGVTSMSETVTVLRVGGTQGPVACVAGEPRPDLWGDAGFLRTVVQNSLATPAQQHASPPPGQQRQRSPASAAPLPDLEPPATPRQAAAPAAGAGGGLEEELPDELPVREGALPGFQDGFFPGHFRAPGPGWEARARLLEGIRRLRARKDQAAERARRAQAA
ncbi:unnamed protein product [Prorocentrum cordatum]|uniref:Methyltransferase small domain-containing protein n=1 Tax=Prorocentrum cordatum TaxID=2364126 RepID=A0ABN9Q6U4_9DINO|nr:unnamed protein product [Polarella glacialis]